MTLTQDRKNKYVMSEAPVGSDGGLALGLTTQVANYAVLDGDFTILGNPPAASSITITLPTAVGRNGKIFNVKKINAPVGDTVTIASAGGNIDGAVSVVLSVQYNSRKIQSDGTDWWII